MPAHEVDVALPTRELGRSDVVFDVKVDGTTLGALHVSRGAVVWFPAGNTYGYKLDWTEFAQIMSSNGVRSEARWQPSPPWPYSAPGPLRRLPNIVKATLACCRAKKSCTRLRADAFSVSLMTSVLC
jgi:hypothetical protein